MTMRLKQIRIAKNKTQLEVAQALQISRGAYGNFETGRRDPDTQTIIKLADYFGVTIDELFGRKAQEKPAQQMSRQEILSEIDVRFQQLPQDLKFQAMAYVAGRIASRKG